MNRYRDAEFLSRWLTDSKSLSFACPKESNQRKGHPHRWRKRVVMFCIQTEAYQRHIPVPLISSAASMRRTYLYFMNTKHHNAPSEGGWFQRIDCQV